MANSFVASTTVRENSGVAGYKAQYRAVPGGLSAVNRELALIRESGIVHAVDCRMCIQQFGDRLSVRLLAIQP